MNIAGFRDQGFKIVVQRLVIDLLGDGMPAALPVSVSIPRTVRLRRDDARARMEQDPPAPHIAGRIAVNARNSVACASFTFDAGSVLARSGRKTAAPGDATVP